MSPVKRPQQRGKKSSHRLRISDRRIASLHNRGARAARSPSFSSIADLLLRVHELLDDRVVDDVE